jgi:hypothetical protein
MIRYQTPQEADRRRIWQVMIRQFELDIDESLLETLVAGFPEATGRDIKGLAKLVAKFCQHKQLPPSLEAFERCAVFRGMELQPSNA